MASRRKAAATALNPLGISKAELRLVEEASYAELESAREAGTLGYLARMLVQVTMPHSKPNTDRFVRSNGGFSVQMLAGDSHIGLPYGSTPRLVLAWMTTEAVRTKNPRLELGRSFNMFLREVGILPEGRTASGGKRGVGRMAQRQTLALFKAIVTWQYHDDRRSRGSNIPIAGDYDLAWDPSRADDLTLWTSTVALSEKFFQEITSAPVPIDFRALKMLKRSPLRLDVYSWLTWRMSYLKAETRIPWEFLKAQFGAGYADNAMGLRDFKKAFIEALNAVRIVYTQARVEPTEVALVLRPSPTHILPR